MVIYEEKERISYNSGATPREGFLLVETRQSSKVAQSVTRRGSNLKLWLSPLRVHVVETWFPRRQYGEMLWNLLRGRA